MRNERGIALVFVLFLVTTISALAVSLTFLANSETYASGNYRLATQGRYGAESGVQRISNFLLDPARYNPATVAPGGLVNANVSPVTFNGQPVILSSNAANSNYPDAATIIAFAAPNATSGTLTAGNTTMTFSGQAKLLTEYSFLDRFTGSASVAQTWEITSDATIGGVHTATVEVSGIIETRQVPAINYAAFSIDPNCASMNFVGNIGTDSYNSSNPLLQGNVVPSAGNGTLYNNGGDVGTNGNLTITGSVNVKGDLFSPKSGVGACVNGAANMTALTTSGAAVVSGNGSPNDVDNPKPLPKMVPFPTPTAQPPTNLDPVNSIGAGTCGAMGLAAPVCTVSGGTLTLQNNGPNPLRLPSINLGSHENLILVATPGVSNEFIMNSISLGAQSTLQVQESASPTPVIINVVGKDKTGVTLAIPIDTTAGTVASPDVSLCPTCSTYDARFMEFIYGGDQTLMMRGHAATAGVIYAPNAYVDFAGTSDLYGAIIAKKIYGHGNFNIHYDQRLQTDGWTMSAPMLTAFSWKNKFN